MANYPAATVFAFGSERVNGAFETIKVARDAIVNDFQRLVVFISTNFTLHNNFLQLGVLRIACCHHQHDFLSHKTYAPLTQKQLGGRDKSVKSYCGVAGGGSIGRVNEFGSRMSFGFMPGRNVGLAGFPLTVADIVVSWS